MVFGTLVGVFVFSVMWSGLLMTSDISCPLWPSVCECHKIECAFTSPVWTELLFILYVNDFYLSSNKFIFLMYADDTTLLSTYDTFHTNTDTNISTIQRNINKELVRVTTWLSRNKLLINTINTKMTVYHTKKNLMRGKSRLRII